MILLLFAPRRGHISLSVREDVLRRIFSRCVAGDVSPTDFFPLRSGGRVSDGPISVWTEMGERTNKGHGPL